MLQEQSRGGEAEVELTGNRAAGWDAEPAAVVLRWCGGRGKMVGLLPPLATFDPFNSIHFGTNILKAQK